MPHGIGVFNVSICLDTTKNKEGSIMKQRIVEGITSNVRFQKIKNVVEVMSKKYGKIVAAGGSLLDCLYGLSFYDIDLFISISDLKDEYKKRYTSTNHIKDVIRDEFEGEMLDIIVVDYPVTVHVSRFDQNFKRISYSLEDGVVVADEAVEDLMNNRISLNTMNGSTVFFRVWKSAMKYNLQLDELDLYLMRNYMTVFGVRLPVKYQSLEHLYEPVEDFDYTLAVLVDNFAETYWSRLPIIPRWRSVRALAKLYMKIFKMNI